MYCVPLGVLKYESCLENVGDVGSVGAAKMLLRATGVLTPRLLPRPVSSMAHDGSSASFSTAVKRVFRDGLAVSDCCTGRLVIARLGAVSADKGWPELGLGGELMEACAVFAETEAVGRPDENMLLFGFAKSEGICDAEGPAWLPATSRSDTACVDNRCDDVLPGNRLVGLPGSRAGEVLDELGAACHCEVLLPGNMLVDVEKLRSASRSGKM
jgi:hypothetical protein